MNKTSVSDHEHPKHTVDTSFWIGIFIGGLLGALLIVLLGTEKGRKLAKKLQAEGLDLWEETKDSVNEKKEAVIEHVEERLEALEETGEKLIEKGEELLEEGKAIEEKVVDKATDVKDRVMMETVAQADAALAHIEKLQERGRETTRELRKKLFKNIPKRTS